MESQSMVIMQMSIRVYEAVNLYQTFLDGLESLYLLDKQAPRT